ncbi:MAG: pre-peptidase C-terminal domain-containing protein [Deltaproteobacteria bacterium]|nr:pre-peptidase C-terminal domain-containing protein [Deltaproteobacteria bacterium]
MTGRTTWVLLAAACLAVVPVGCSDDDSTHDTADDAGDVDVEVREDVGPDADADGDEDVGIDADVEEDEGVDADAEAEADADGEADGDVPVGTCDEPRPLACGDRLTAESTAAGGAELDGYSCTSYPETGPETVYSLVGTAQNRVTISMTPSTGGDLDLFLLGADCAPAACLAASASTGSENLTFTAEVGATYRVVVDGFEGAAGGYSLEVTCAAGEICGNGADDNGNGLVDCMDSQCWSSAACDETCTGGLDEDYDGLVDCLDVADCGADAACAERSCDDAVDNDGDGATDCADWDCIGSADCPAGLGAVGDACTSHADCADRACLLEATWGWPGGYCTKWSTEDDTCGGCPSGSTCYDYSGWGYGPYFCLRGCTDGTDCRTGVQVCHAGTVCVGACTDGAQCTATGHCGAGLCTTPPEECGVVGDEDGDTRADCADPDCAFLAACIPSATTLEGGAVCSTAAALTLPTDERGAILVTGTLDAADGDDRLPACGYVDSVDVFYRFTLTRAARVSVRLESRSDPPGAPIVALAYACEEPDFQCAAQSGTTRLEVTLGAGTYSLTVDAYDGGLGPYELGLLLGDP